MAHTDQGNRRGYLRAGHGTAGHKAGKEPAGHVYRGSCAANSIVCGGKRTKQHPKKAGGGHRGSQGTRRSFWAATPFIAGEF